MRGKFKKKTAKVVSVNLKKRFAYLEGMQTTKKEGTKVNLPFHPSVLQIKTLYSEDKQRLNNSTKNAKTTKGEKNAPNKA